eukprot:353414-Chlamydomonas_euryale.AAC.11
MVRALVAERAAHTSQVGQFPVCMYNSHEKPAVFVGESVIGWLGHNQPANLIGLPVCQQDRSTLSADVATANGDIHQGMHVCLASSLPRTCYLTTACKSTAVAECAKVAAEGPPADLAGQQLLTTTPRRLIGGQANRQGRHVRCGAFAKGAAGDCA